MVYESSFIKAWKEAIKNTPGIKKRIFEISID